MVHTGHATPGGPQAPPKPVPESARAAAGQVYTMAEVEKHDSAKSAWFAHGGKARASRACLSGPCVLRSVQGWALASKASRKEDARQCRIALCLPRIALPFMGAHR
jgi:hypothetical protein